MYKARFEDRVFLQGGIEHHQAHGHSLIFVTISEPTSARPYRDSGAALSAFLRELNRFAGHRSKAGLPWVAVGEHGEQSGRFHWHLCVADLMYPWDRSRTSLFKGAGVTNPEAGRRYTVLGHSGVAVSKNATMIPLAKRHGFGHQFVGMRQVGFTSDDVGAVGNYLSKYLSKGSAGHSVDATTGEVSTLPKGFQLVRASRGKSAWWPGHSLMQIREDTRREYKESKRKEALQRRGVKGEVSGGDAERGARSTLDAGSQLLLVT